MNKEKFMNMMVDGQLKEEVKAEEQSYSNYCAQIGHLRVQTKIIKKQIMDLIRKRDDMYKKKIEMERSAEILLIQIQNKKKKG